MKLYPDDWRIRISTAVGAGIGIAGALLLGPVVGINRFLPGGLPIIVGGIVGILLGRLVGGLLFRPPASGPPDDKKRTS